MIVYLGICRIMWYLGLHLAFSFYKRRANHNSNYKINSSVMYFNEKQMDILPSSGDKIYFSSYFFILKTHVMNLISISGHQISIEAWKIREIKFCTATNIEPIPRNDLLPIRILKRFFFNAHENCVFDQMKKRLLSRRFVMKIYHVSVHIIHISIR